MDLKKNNGKEFQMKKIIMIMTIIIFCVINLQAKQEIIAVMTKTATLTASSSATYTSAAIEMYDADSVYFVVEVTAFSSTQTYDSLTFVAKVVPVGWDGTATLDITNHTTYTGLTSVINKSANNFAGYIGSWYDVNTTPKPKFKLNVKVTNGNSATSVTYTFKIRMVKKCLACS